MIKTQNWSSAVEDQHGLEDLLVRTGKGDRAAFSELYEHFARPLMAYCLSFTRNADDAQDLFQATMLKVYESAKNFSAGNVFGWVFTIARNAGRSWERKTKRLVPLDPTEAQQIAGNNKRYEDVEEVELVQQAILALPDEFREIILMRYFGGFSVREIAEALEITESLVKVRLFRGRDKLRDSLGPLIGPDA